jgi:murein L,D-transpeptidase YafK
VGCYAMTDDGIKEIYALARETFRGGNSAFQLQLLPFRMTEDNFARHAASPYVSFWRNLKTGVDAFNQSKQPPLWDVCEQRYVFNLNDPRTSPLDPNGPCPTGTFSTMAAL